MRQIPMYIMPAAFLLGGFVGLGLAALASELGDGWPPRAVMRSEVIEVAGLAEVGAGEPPPGPTEELQRARQEVARYRTGLGRAVIELNRLAATCRPESASVRTEHHPAPRAENRPASEAKESPRTRSKVRLQGPQLQPWGEELIALGILKNPGDVEADAELLLELVHDGEVIDEELVLLSVPASGETPFEVPFWAGQLEGSYTIRGRLME